MFLRVVACQDQQSSAGTAMPSSLEAAVLVEESVKLCCNGGFLDIPREIEVDIEITAEVGSSCKKGSTASNGPQRAEASLRWQ
eukprot:7837297-Heterocapsa_arctica.AAC.1